MPDVSIAQGFWGWAWLFVAVGLFLFFFGLVVTMFFRLLLARPTQFAGSEPERSKERRALDERYQRGEIDQETYTRLREGLDRQ